MGQDNQVVTTPKIRTWECVVNMTGYLEGGIKDWPSHIQDRIFAALEVLAHQVELPLAIVDSYFDVDYGETPELDQPYIRVIASEIVAKDERFSDVDYMKREFDKLIRGENSSLSSGLVH